MSALSCEPSGCSSSRADLVVRLRKSAIKASILGRQCLAAELVKGGLAAGPKVELELVGEVEQVPPGIAIAARELFDQVLDPRRRSGEETFFVANRERYFLAQRRLQQNLKIGRNRADKLGASVSQISVRLASALGRQRHKPAVINFKQLIVLRVKPCRLVGWTQANHGVSKRGGSTLFGKHSAVYHKAR